MAMNGYFKTWDKRANEVEGYSIPDVWWSRVYEYPWAIQFAEGIAADMGAGWMDRPFKDMLAKRCDEVYAFDVDGRVLELQTAPNVHLICKDFTRKMDAYRGAFDTIFCISVLEDVPDIGKALKEFEKCLKPGGRIVITMDVQYDLAKPLGKYPGVNMEKFIWGIHRAGLQFVGDVDFDKMGAVVNPDFNLCCFHCVLERFDESDAQMG